MLSSSHQAQIKKKQNGNVFTVFRSLLILEDLAYIILSPFHNLNIRTKKNMKNKWTYWTKRTKIRDVTLWKNTTKHECSLQAVDNFGGHPVASSAFHNPSPMLPSQPQQLTNKPQAELERKLSKSFKLIVGLLKTKSKTVKTTNKKTGTSDLVRENKMSTKRVPFKAYMLGLRFRSSLPAMWESKKKQNNWGNWVECK